MSRLLRTQFNQTCRNEQRHLPVRYYRIEQLSVKVGEEIITTHERAIVGGERVGSRGHRAAEQMKAAQEPANVTLRCYLLRNEKRP